MCEDFEYFLAMRPRREAERARRGKCARRVDSVPRREPMRQVRTGGTREEACESEELGG